MQLRGVPPKETRRGLKLFVYSEPGVGKSYFCSQFKNAYFIDTEEGAKMSKYVDNINNNKGALFSTRKFNDLAQELVALSGVEHPYETLVIDSITPIYDDLVEEERDRIKKEGRRTKISEEYQVANSRFKKMVWLLLDLPMNVVITAHAKREYG